MQKIKILGVKFDNVNLLEAFSKVTEFLKSGKKHYICTPNPEMLLIAQKKHKFLEIINKSSLNIPDGFGILLAAKWQKTPLKERVTGTDLMKMICEKSYAKIFLLGAGENVAEKVREKFSKTKIVGTYTGSPSLKDELKIRKLINESGAEILFVAYGAPAQELWISRNLKHLKVSVAIGVGGAFDFLSGKIKRAPKWMRKFGLEWLYRLIKEPKRIKRIYNATIKFLVKYLISK